MTAPLAERMRPEDLDGYFGQSHLVGPGKVLRQMMEQKALSSMVFWGPPGTGKTTLAQIMARSAELPFVSLSAVTAGVKEVRETIALARKSGRVLLFIDEIHRFNKAQQDYLLGAVQKGEILLIGATTENPSFEVIPALLSRCQVYVLEAFTQEELRQLLDHALANDAWLQEREVSVVEEEALFRLSGGDGRRLLNLVELIAQTRSDRPLAIDNTMTEQVVQQRMAAYDKTGEQHYDTISAFIKSMRGSDPNAAVYYLARMVEGGEDPVFIARRMLILASEDIGNANPNALLLATSCFQAVTMLGYPECSIVLSQVAVYLATSPKSNSTYAALRKAGKAVKQHGDLSIPLPIRNAPTKLMKDLDYGKDYRYAHDHADNFADMEFLPEALSGEVFYEPGQNKREEDARRFLRARWKDKYGY